MGRTLTANFFPFFSGGHHGQHIVGGDNFAILVCDFGIIDRYAVILNPRKAGFALSSMTLVSLARHEERSVDNFISEVMRHPEVLECFATSGEADFHLRVVVEDIDAYNQFLDDFIFQIPGVSQVRSNIVLKEIKADTALPLKP